jgi:hypothetical protein
MNEMLKLAAVSLLALEDSGVRVAARSGGYGSTRLVLIDAKTGEEHSLEAVLEEAGKDGYNVSANENKSGYAKRF